MTGSAHTKNLELSCEEAKKRKDITKMLSNGSFKMQKVMKGMFNNRFSTQSPFRASWLWASTQVVPLGKIYKKKSYFCYPISAANGILHENYALHRQCTYDDENHYYPERENLF